jgi:hypothetical protein
MAAENNSLTPEQMAARIAELEGRLAKAPRLASRPPGFFKDRALESRCLTEETGGPSLRDDIPISLPQSFKDEAQSLRNQLLLYCSGNSKRAGRAKCPIARSSRVSTRSSCHCSRW